MKFQIVLINFPFDDFSGSKLRPSICLTNKISVHNHIVLAPISSNINNATEPTDLIVQDKHPGFKKTGLKVSSVIKLHRLITVSDNIIQKIIGVLPDTYHNEIEDKIKSLFSISTKST